MWALAWLALRYGNEMIGEEAEPYLLLGSGVIVIIVGAFMAWPLIRRSFARVARPPTRSGHTHDHGYDHAHGRSHVHKHGDAHAQAHARDIEREFGDGTASFGQTLVFGLTGGLIPGPAAIPVLLLCLNIGQFWLAVRMVAAFSAGLAITLVSVGTVAALGVRFARNHGGNFDRF